jgi:hypothetical protein
MDDAWRLVRSRLRHAKVKRVVEGNEIHPASMPDLWPDFEDNCHQSVCPIAGTESDNHWVSCTSRRL